MLPRSTSHKKLSKIVRQSIQRADANGRLPTSKKKKHTRKKSSKKNPSYHGGQLLLAGPDDRSPSSRKSSSKKSSTKKISTKKISTKKSSAKKSSTKKSSTKKISTKKTSSTNNALVLHSSAHTHKKMGKAMVEVDTRPASAPPRATSVVPHASWPSRAVVMSEVKERMTEANIQAAHSLVDARILCPKHVDLVVALFTSLPIPHRVAATDLTAYFKLLKIAFHPDRFNTNETHRKFAEQVSMVLNRCLETEGEWHGAGSSRSPGKAEPAAAKEKEPPQRERYLIKLPPFPPLDLPHQKFVAQVSKDYARFQWVAPKLADACHKGSGNTGVALSHTQEFIRHFMTPRSPFKGIMLVISTGGGKTCSAVALSENFKRVIWVTKGSMLKDTGLTDAIGKDLCSGVMREWKALGKTIPDELSKRLSILRTHGSRWITPMTYRQFANAVRPGTPTALGQELISTSPAGAKDPLAEALVVVDESQNLYDPNLPPLQKPNMKWMQDAIHRSHKVSGANSVKTVLLTATPGYLPEQVFGQLNLLLDPTRQELLPTTRKDFIKEFVNPANNMLIGKRVGLELIEQTKGLISYLNALKDASKFAQVQRMEMVKVTISNVQEQKLAECLGQHIGDAPLLKNGKPSKRKPAAASKKPGECMRERLMAAEKPKLFDSASGFRPAELWKRLPEIAPRLVTLLGKMEELDKADQAKYGHVFKHVVFCDMNKGLGEKLVISAMIASGRYNFVLKKKSGGGVSLHPNTVTGKYNFAALTTIGMYGAPMSKATTKELVDPVTGLYNATANQHGADCQVLVINDDYQVGINAFDTRYVHFVTPPLTAMTREQVEGRGTRFCHSRALPWEKDKGWQIFVYTYGSDWATPQGAGIIAGGSDKAPYEVAASKLSSGDLVAQKWTNSILNRLYQGAIDYGLNKAINRN